LTDYAAAMRGRGAYADVGNRGVEKRHRIEREGGDLSVLLHITQHIALFEIFRSILLRRPAFLFNLTAGGDDGADPVPIGTFLVDEVRDNRAPCG